MSAAPSRPWLGLLGWLALPYLAMVAGAIASIDAASFYRDLARPHWSPPGWIFGPVWTTLYTLMGVAAWLVWRRHGWRGAAPALTLFIVHLVPNALWSWLFFAWRQGGLAFVEVLVLWALILALVVAFWRLHRAAGLLLLPYLAWVSFASVLNWTVWKLNPGVL